ncbi:hypothetical protein KEJ48_05150 [Candidatus Bathyarchaeota archaeon]|nr:hypothetical protein [Candidatus Bathyarchaeota archaeon]
MSFPVFFKVIDQDYAEIVLQRDYEPLAFKQEMNLVSFTSTVDCYVKFNSLDDKPKRFLAGYTYNYFTPIRLIYSKKAEEQDGILYIWAEKVIT